MDLDKYYENCSKPQKRILDVLKSVDYDINSTDLSEMSDVSIKNISRYLKPLIIDNIIVETIVSPENSKIRYKYYRLSDKKTIENTEIKQIPKKTTTDSRVKVIKQKIDISEIRNELKSEILDEIKKTLANNTVIQESKTEIIKIINTLPIRQVDKKELGLTHLTSKQVRNYMIDLLNLMTTFKL